MVCGLFSPISLIGDIISLICGLISLISAQINFTKKNTLLNITENSHTTTVTVWLFMLVVFFLSHHSTCILENPVWSHYVGQRLLYALNRFEHMERYNQYRCDQRNSWLVKRLVMIFTEPWSLWSHTVKVHALTHCQPSDILIYPSSFAQIERRFFYVAEEIFLVYKKFSRERFVNISILFYFCWGASWESWKPDKVYEWVSSINGHIYL